MSATTRTLSPPSLLPWREAWRALRSAFAVAPRIDARVELSERTLDDIGAPGWLRRQAAADRDAAMDRLIDSARW